MDKIQSLAAAIGIKEAREHDSMAEQSASKSERAQMRMIAGQLRKAAYEIATGNFPVRVESDGQAYWLVASRSNLTGRIVSLRIGCRELTPDELQDCQLEFCTTGGTIYEISDSTMGCQCERGILGCWHSTSVDLYRTALAKIGDIDTPASGEGLNLWVES